MRAWLFRDFGGCEELVLEDLPKPEPRGGEVMVKVVCAGLNPLDSKMREGELKWISGLRLPQRIGLEFSGVVEAIGRGVTSFAVGDRVCGVPPGMPGRGTMAEFICARECEVAKLPEGVSFEEGAALVICGQTALRSLQKVAAIRGRQRLLVHGCSGGVGLFALQIGTLLGAYVEGVCGAQGLAISQRLGAMQVYDYRVSGLDELDGNYDVILPLSGKLSFTASRRLLSTTGAYINPTPGPTVWLTATVANVFRKQRHLPLLVKTRRSDLVWLLEQVSQGAIEVCIDREFGFARVPDAYEHLDAGGCLGKVIVRI